MSARASFLRLCESLDLDPIEQENACLSIGSGFLPSFAREIRDGGEYIERHEDAYWTWLAEQVEVGATDVEVGS